MTGDRSETVVFVKDYIDGKKKKSRSVGGQRTHRSFKVLCVSFELKSGKFS